MNPASGPAQPGGGKQDHGPDQCCRFHIRTLSRSRRQVTRGSIRARVRDVHGTRKDGVTAANRWC
jgi:hypothetical protein